MNTLYFEQLKIVSSLFSLDGGMGGGGGGGGGGGSNYWYSRRLLLYLYYTAGSFIHVCVWKHISMSDGWQEWRKYFFP